MTTLFIASNVALESASTSITAGASYATGGKCMLQLAVPANGLIRVVEYGLSFDGSAAGTPATVLLREASAASTMSTQHTTSTIDAITDIPTGANTRLDCSSTAKTGYGNGAITSATTNRIYDRQYIAPTNQYVKMWPLGQWPECGGTAATYLQLCINTTPTVNAYAYIIWEENI